jgi:hypothetical protein
MRPLPIQKQITNSHSQFSLWAAFGAPVKAGNRLVARMKSGYSGQERVLHVSSVTSNNGETWTRDKKTGEWSTSCAVGGHTIITAIAPYPLPMVSTMEIEEMEVSQ